jgi:hypothetical protein
VAATVFFSSCTLSGCAKGESQTQKEGTNVKLPQMRIVEGENKALGNGTVYSWVMLDSRGKPLAIGINFSESALKGLPEKSVAEYTLALPKEAACTAFDHISVDWNPQGHEPQGIYDRAHFDIHFYMISPEDRDKITASKEDCKKLSKKPASQYVPEDYISTPGGVPRMGAHWIDPKAPEFSGQPFKETFIYGFYDGKMVFLEPMVTKAFLETKPKLSKDLKLPKCYPKSGYYPTSYSISYNAEKKQHTLALEGLTLR